MWHGDGRRRHLTLVRPPDAAPRITATSQLPVAPSVGEMLEAGRRRWGRREALVDGAVRLTFDELSEAVAAASAGMASIGIGPGTSVGLFADRSWTYVVSVYAALRCGATIALMHAAWQPREVLFGLVHADVEVLFVGDMACELLTEIGADGGTSPRLPRLRQVVALQGDGPSVDDWVRAGATPLDDARGGELLFYTSKCGEYARGVRVDPLAALGCGFFLGERLGISEQDRHLNLLPLRHSGGIVNAMFCMHQRGATLVLFERFDARSVARLAIEERCTTTGGSAILAGRLLEELVAGGWSADVHLNRLWAAPRLELTREIVDLGVRQIECYGLAEASNLVTVSSIDDGPGVGAGSPLPGVELKVVDRSTGAEVHDGVTGELCFRGWNLARGYHREPRRMREAIDDEGFYHTGDLGHVDEGGNLAAISPRGGTLRTGGELISISEVERVLNSGWDQVFDAVVVGVDDPHWGEVGVAVVLCEAGAEVTLDDLRDHCRQRLAGYKTPKHVVPLTPSEWPLLPDGRLDRARLRAVAGARIRRRGSA